MNFMYYIPVVPYYVPVYPCQQPYMPRQNAYEGSWYFPYCSQLTNSGGNSFVPHINQNAMQNIDYQTTNWRSEHPTEKSLYERLGGIYRIAAITDHFVDSLADDPIVGTNTSNAYLRDWYENKRWRASGFKVLNTLWIAEKAGGPYEYVSTVPNNHSLDLEPTHYKMMLTAEEFNAAANVLANSLDHFNVPEREKNEVLEAFMAHKKEVISGSIKQ
ncbi:group 1 truncated hemoglobin [Lentibacillus cibarius]|uniref:Group 1 truncated hemoglobin n=2 Tax=Lentibacillus cibarius TaxID=2583219 RepID=A0A5S3QLY0_9BACI|nr:group 1 truncated hemoglobin [Lentibacillus cibarius]